MSIIMRFKCTLLYDDLVLVTETKELLLEKLGK